MVTRLAEELRHEEARQDDVVTLEELLDVVLIVLLLFVRLDIGLPLALRPLVDTLAERDGKRRQRGRNSLRSGREGGGGRALPFSSSLIEIEWLWSVSCASITLAWSCVRKVAKASYLVPFSIV